MKKFTIIYSLFFLMLLLFLCCGCLGDSGENDQEKIKEFAAKVNSSREYYDQMVESDPNNATAWCIRGMYYNNGNFNQYEEALESADRALEIDPEYGLAWLLRGYVLLNTGNVSEAELSFENAIRYDPGLEEFIPEAGSYNSGGSNSYCLIYSDFE